MTDRALSPIILAAGAGTRMRSTRPKPLHVLAGRTLLHYMIDALADCHVSRIVVVIGHGGDQMRDVIENLDVDVDLSVVEQIHQDGTGDATAVGMTGLPDWSGDEDDDVIVLPGDMPLLRPATIAALVHRHRTDDAAATILSAIVANASGYGRVIR